MHSVMLIDLVMHVLLGIVEGNSRGQNILTCLGTLRFVTVCNEIHLFTLDIQFL
jgi:hypothetical protein